MRKSTFCCPNCGYKLVSVNEHKLTPPTENQMLGITPPDDEAAAGAALEICGKCVTWDIGRQETIDPFGIAHRTCPHINLRVSERGQRKCWSAAGHRRGEHITRPLGGVSGQPAESDPEALYCVTCIHFPKLENWHGALKCPVSGILYSVHNYNLKCYMAASCDIDAEIDSEIDADSAPENEEK